MKKKISIIRTLILVTLSVTMLISCGKEDEQAVVEQLRPVRTMLLLPVDAARVHEFTAVVDASQKADLSFKVSGQLAEFFVKQGDRVVKGDVIARLDDTDISIQLNEARALYEKARSEYTRGRALIKKNYISKVDFGKLKASYNAAQAQLEGAKNNLRYTELIASFDGVIAKTYTERFQEISAKSAIVRLHDISKIKLLVDIPESIMIRLNKDNQQSRVIAVFNSIPEQSFQLTFSEVTTLADEVTKTYQVIFLMDTPKNYTILPGMTAVVSAELNIDSATAPSFYLPTNIVLKQGETHYVFVLTKVAEGKGKITKKVITIGEITPLGIEIFSGLEQGELVVTAGMSKILDGMMVKF
ncbi:MAG: efflux RND transporter periplasmic adaptor subunit [Pseudomonadales bacterium]|nr:efflux RND transporter periplasmic adaptor subunit [Pseudomonadales bacterium]NRA18382.1 efflux RND transporter periplasmic adaptor subunit [Oceanospirillaceae bacterium]